MEKFEQQFENLDVQSNYMETAMSDTSTLTVPQVRPVFLLLHPTCTEQYFVVYKFTTKYCSLQ